MPVADPARKPGLDTAPWWHKTSNQVITLAAGIVSGVAIWLITGWLAADPVRVPVLSLDRPTAVPMTLGEAYDRYRIPPGETSASQLRQLGVLLVANLRVVGHTGEKLRASCSLHDQTSGRTEGPFDMIIVVDEQPDFAEPCWIRTRPGHRYQGIVVIDGKLGDKISPPVTVTGARR